MEKFPEIAGYKVTGRLGEGGMGVVWRAEQLGTHRQVALKLLGTASFASTRAKARFEREVELAARLDHPGIARVYESGVHQGVYYYAMELIDAGSPVDRFADKAMLSREARVALVREIALAVQHAHQRGVIHRDLKPGNILVTPDGKPHVLDFGLAKASMNDAAGRTISLSGEIAGTPAYMSPEQASGRTEELDTRSDVYSLGVILYELLTGALPHDMTGGHLDVFRRISEDDIRPARSVDKTIDRELDAVLLKAMSHLPADRYESAGALAHDLTNYLEGNPLAARAPTLGYLLRKRAWKHRRALAAVAVLAMVVAGVVLLVMRISGQAARSHRVNTLNAAMRDVIDGGRWTQAEVESIDAMINQLRGLRADDEADRAAKQVNDALAASIDGMIRSPRMTEELAGTIRARIQVLASRSPGIAESLSQQLSARVRNWERVFEVVAPETLRYADVIRDAGEIAWARGNIRCEVMLGNEWEDASTLQVMIRNSTAASGDLTGDYIFSMQMGKSAWNLSSPENPTFRTLDQEIGVAVVQISRSGQALLRRTVMPIAELHGKDLRIVVLREGDRVSFQLNDLPALSALDIEPIQMRGPFSFSLPSKALQSIRLFRQPLPPEAGPLERADHLFGDGQYAEALAEYGEVIRTARAPEHVAEARYKWAVAAQRLKRRDEAIAAWGEVFASNARRWPLLAGCQLALAWREEGRAADATMMMDAMIARFPPSELGEFLIDEMRIRLVNYVQQETHSVDLMLFNDETVPRLERMLQLEEAFKSNPMNLNEVRRSLIRAYQMQGRNTDALKMIEVLAAEKQAYGEQLYTWLEPCEAYGRITRILGMPERALPFVLARLKTPDGKIKRALAGLLIESARIRLGMGDQEGALRDLDALDSYAGEARSPIPTRCVMFASLLRGVLADERGDHDEAIRIWREGYSNVIRRSDDPAYPGDLLYASRAFAGMELLTLSMLGSLGDALNETVSQQIVSRMFELHTGGTAVMALRADMGKVAHPIMRGMWRTERGRKFVSSFARGTTSLPDLSGTAPLLAIHEFVLPDNDTNSSQGRIREQAYWEVAPDMSRHLIAGKMSTAQIVSLLLAWKGMTTGPGWSAVGASIPQAVRAPISYYLGVRYLRLGRPADAKGFFQAALADTAAGSTMARAIESELQHIANGHASTRPSGPASTTSNSAATAPATP